MKPATRHQLVESGYVVANALPANPLRSRVVSGSLIMLAGSGLVGAANLVYNVAVARMLGPAGFGHAAAVYTLLMLMSAVTLAFQIVCAKLVAKHESPLEKTAVYSGLHERAWRYGIGIGVLLILARNVLSRYLNVPDPMLIVLLGIGTAFYIPLGARRGGMQGTYSFGALAINLILEGLVRLGGALLLIHLGLGVRGAVLASAAAVMLAYSTAVPPAELKVHGARKIDASFGEGLQAIVFFIGQVIINNFDIILVKHFFPPETAGLYAAVALVGRVVNMCAWSVVNTMFPVSAGTRTPEKEARPVLITSLLLVGVIVFSIAFGLWAVPSFIWRSVFGARFALAGYGAVSPLLVLYAVETGVYSLSSVVIAYEMSRKIVNTAWLQLAFSAVLVLGIYFFHNTLHQVLLVQLYLMLLLLLIVLLPALRMRVFRKELAGSTRPPFQFGHLTLLSHLTPLSEDAVIAEFLKNEFHHPEFDPYRGQFETVVTHPNLESRDENALRRALLFIRRGAMWRELPDDTQWFSVQLTVRELPRIRVFPRANWRRVAEGSFYLQEVVKRIEEEMSRDPDDEFFCKLRRLGPVLQQQARKSSVLLIGVDEQSPLTILDGNHRITAAMMSSPSSVVSQFHFICGYSSHMTECCWYETNMTTLWRYARNLVLNMSYDPQSDISRFLEARQSQLS
jgi:O-antigen/teichoic acid export membrane protein